MAQGMWWSGGGGAEAELLIGPVSHQGGNQALAVAMQAQHCGNSTGDSSISMAALAR